LYISLRIIYIHSAEIPIGFKPLHITNFFQHFSFQLQRHICSPIYHLFSNLSPISNKRLPGSLHHHVTTHTAYSQTRFCAFLKRTKKVNNSRYQHFEGQSQSRCAAALRRKREALPVGRILGRPADYELQAAPACHGQICHSVIQGYVDNGGGGLC
jgi:hypothetical protein